MRGMHIMFGLQAQEANERDALVCKHKRQMKGMHWFASTKGK
jgi:hypothetical protein